MAKGLFPVLSSADKPFYPKDGQCPVCGSGFRDGFAYLGAGALLMSEDGKDSLHSDAHRHQAFMHITFHGKEPDLKSSANVTVVDQVHGGQFDFQWCSVACMREWLLKLLAEVERLQTCEPTESDFRLDDTLFE